jgi:hypothetical protein
LPNQAPHLVGGREGSMANPTMYLVGGQMEEGYVQQKFVWRLVKKESEDILVGPYQEYDTWSGRI